MPRLEELIVEKENSGVAKDKKKKRFDQEIKKVFLDQDGGKYSSANIFYGSGENFHEPSLNLNKLYMMDDKSFSKKINEMKKMQFDNLNYEPSKELLNSLKEKKEEILSMIKYPITDQNIKNMNKLNEQLKDAFVICEDKENKERKEIEERENKERENKEKIKYTQGYQRLPDFTNKRIENGYYKVLISNLRKNDIGICLGKIKKESNQDSKKIIEESIKYDIPNKNLIGSDYLRGDEIVIEFKKTGDKINIKEVDKRYYELQKKGLLNRKIDYLPQSLSKIISGKIVGLGEDKKGEEVIFEQENGNKFALKIETLLKGIQKPEKIKEKKIEIKKPSVSKIVYDGSQEVSGRDGEKIVYKNQK